MSRKNPVVEPNVLQQNLHHKKKILMFLKEAYDTNGKKGIAYMLEGILEAEFANESRKADLLELILFLTFKIDTCDEDCFENLEDKWFCRCECNDSLVEVHFFDQPEAVT